MGTLPEPPSLEEQVEAVKAARDHLARSAQWRAGRRGWNPRRHARDVAALEAAIATLTIEKIRRDGIDAILFGPVKVPSDG